MVKQTAIEIFAEITAQIGYVSEQFLQECKELEKQQIIDACNIDKRQYDNAEQYYNETFKQ
jgi:hypothetical protein